MFVDARTTLLLGAVYLAFLIAPVLLTTILTTIGIAKALGNCARYGRRVVFAFVSVHIWRMGFTWPCSRSLFRGR